MTLWTMSTLGEGLQSAAVFMRSPDSSESRPLKVRETTMTKGVAALTVSWATAGEATNRGGAGAPRCLRTLEAHTPTNQHRGLIVGSEGVLTMTKLHCFLGGGLGFSSISEVQAGLMLRSGH